MQGEVISFHIYGLDVLILQSAEYYRPGLAHNPAILAFLDKLSKVDCIHIKALEQSRGILAIAIADKRGLSILRRGFAVNK